MYNDFYIKLGIKVFSICDRLRNLNGGLLSIKEIVEINNSNKYNDKISQSDVKTSMKSFVVFGQGCQIVNDQYINLSPFSLNEDSQLLIKHFNDYRVIRKNEIISIHGWITDRFNLAVVYL